MDQKSAIVLGQPRSFYRPAPGQLVRPVPPSPMVVQTLIGAIQALGQKMDALAVTAQRPVDLSAFIPTTALVRQVESRELEAEPVDDAPPVPAPRTKVNRNKRLEFFD